MKVKQGKEVYSNKSGLVEKKSSNLVIKTQLENSFDNRWAQIKIQGKNIANRSNHIAAVFSHYFYIHGGYDVDKGLIEDFYEMDISENCQEYIWKKLNNTCDGKQIRLKGHTAVVYKQNLVLYGGQIQTNVSNNVIYIYDFVTKNWKAIHPKDNVAPKVDSHCSVIVENKMYIYGGYISDKAEYLRDIIALNLDNFTWEIIHKCDKNDPEGRSNFAMVEFNGNLLMFGGTNGSRTLNDMWLFDLKGKKWSLFENKQTPESRRGHSMIKYQNYLFMFGGIQDVTKQKNDIYIFQLEKAQWFKIHTTTNAVYDCSPTLKKDSRRNKSPQAISPVRMSPEKSQRIENTMKKIISQNKQKKFQERKKQLLKQFSQKSSTQLNKKRDLSPTTESMVKTLQTIGNQQATHKQLKQQIIYDDTHRFIIGKKPCARDGQTVTIYNNKMYIFGGDRHLMAFNDLYQFDLSKGVKSLELYKH